MARTRLPRWAPVALGLMILLGSSGCGSEAGQTAPYQQFHSRPDLKPIPVRVLTRAHDTASGYLFIAPKKRVAQAGPLILDDRGKLVWFRPLDTGGVTDFRVQRYRGEPVLTWWRGKPRHGDGSGEYAIVDSSYRTVARVRPGNGLIGDIHEFLLTPRGTALLTIFHRVHPGRLTLEGAVQEVDVATGRVLFEWHSIDHVALSESYAERPRRAGAPFDYFHVNSIDVDTDGNLLVSARNTHAVYKISRRTGKILWRLGGRRSDFRFGPGARFAWQHDARRLRDGTISLFDNEAGPQTAPESRAIVLRLDLRKRRATLVRSYVHHPALLSVDQGNAQTLPGGHLLVGWGHNPFLTEYDRRGRVVFDARFGAGSDSYRAYRFRWHARPLEKPAIGFEAGRVYASWNGATEVRRWRLLAGSSRGALRAVRTVGHGGFETALGRSEGEYAAARALDANGHVLGTSPTVPVP